jgi:hypothetical protein
VPRKPPQNAGKVTDDKPKDPTEYTAATEDPAALAAPEASVGAFAGRQDFATPAEGRNPLGERMAELNGNGGFGEGLP